MKQILTKLLHVRTAMMLLATAVLTLTAQTAWADSVTYLDANGVEKTCNNSNSFSSCIYSFSPTINVGEDEQTTWYVVDKDINILNQPINISGNVNLILANGKKLTITDNNDNIYNGIYLTNNSSLNIYSQSHGSDKGQLTITTSHTGISIENCNLTINGGLISITATSDGIYVGNGSVTINNGDVTINSTNSKAISNTSNYTRNGGTVKMYDYTATHPITDYVNAAGVAQPAVQATVLDSDRNLGDTGHTTWYVVNSDLLFNNLLYIFGDVNLILADGKELTVNSPADSYGIYISDNSSLTIYTQSHSDNKGKLTVSGSTGIRVGNGSLTINGGLISVTSKTSFQAAIDVDSEGSVTLNNGEVTTTGYGAITDMSRFTQNGGLLNGFDGQLDTENTNYLDVNGEQQSATATVIESGLYKWGNSNENSWYVVKDDITLPKGIHIYGNVNLILADSKKLTVNAPGYERGIYITSNSSLTIFAQSNGENKGKLSITGGRNGDGIFVDGSDDRNTSLTINGGEITTTGGETEAAGIQVYEGASVTINGGCVTVKGGTNATGGLKFQNGGTVTLGCNTTSDFVQINGIVNVDISGTLGTVQVKSGQALIDEDGNEYSGTLTAEQQTALSGKKLTLVNGTLLLANNDTQNTSLVSSNNNKTIDVKLSGRTLYKDGGWNTICLPFNVDLNADDCPLAGATARTLSEASIDGSTLNLNFDNPVTTLVAGTPYIIKWEKADGYVDDDAHNIVAPVFLGVTIVKETHNFTSGSGDTKVQFIGTYDKVTFEELDRSILFVGAENTLYYPNGSGVTTIGACRAYFKIGDGANARQITDFDFNFDGGETTAVFDLKNNEQIINNNWYTLDGRKLDSKPTQKGVYINNGHKVVVK